MKTKVEINQQLLENQREALHACMTVDSEMADRLREAIFQEMKAARDKIVEQIRFDNGDPRGTAHAVKRYVASKYLGGVVSIASYNAKASGTKNTYEAPRKLRPGQRGGNRMERGGRTAQILGYGPHERMFILNWLNAGTRGRYSGHGRNGRTDAAYERFILRYEGRGWRGAITPRGFFKTLGDPAMETAIKNLSKMVDEEFEKLLKE